MAELADELIRMTDEDLRLQQGASAGGEAYQRWAQDYMVLNSPTGRSPRPTPTGSRR